MTPERWEKIKQLFHSALELQPTERAEFLTRECVDDTELGAEVESLLTSHKLADSFIETPASDIAAGLLLEGQARLLAGQMVGHFRVAEALATGGMGDVYLAEDTRLGRKVALKLLPERFTVNADRVRRFGQEARTASALNHPNIVTIYEIGQIDSLHFIATEYVDGKTLRQHLTNSELTIGEVLDLTVQITSALQAAHEAGIIHRDIKPENIMLRHDGVVKVLDFGLAKLTKEVGVVDGPGLAQSTIQTNPGVVMGTVAYMSPEQARGAEVDGRSDIWSVGVVLYEMVSGRAPFVGETSSHVLVSILESEPPPVSLSAEVPAELNRIIAKALCKNRGDRYQLASDLASELKTLTDNLKINAMLNQVLEPSASGLEITRTDRRGVTVRQLIPQTADFPASRTVRLEHFANEIKRHKMLALAASLILALGVLAYIRINENKAELYVPGKKSIAVLPLKPVNVRDRIEIYEFGIADSLILKLSSMKGFLVRPLSATRRYSDIEQDPLAAGREQKVDYVLASNYQLAGGKIRVTAQLFNVASGQIEETYKGENDTANVFSMQDEIASEVENILSARFGSASSRPAAKRGTTNEEAYRLYLQGMYLYDKRTLGDSRKAVEVLEQAVQLDPNYAQAWAGKAHARRAVANFGRSSDIHEQYQESIEAINKALELDPNLADAHSALCENKMNYEWDFAGAERECKRAIELDPNSSLAHQIYSRCLMGLGRFDEAIAEINIAIDLEPASRFNHRLYGNILYNARLFEDAVLQFKRVIAMDPNFVSAYLWLVKALDMQGKHAEAFDWWMKLLALEQADNKTVQIYKTAYQRFGWPGILRERVKRFERGDEAYFHGASFYARLGNKEKAYEFLEKSYQGRELWMHVLNVEPTLDSLRSDPRFDELVRRVELK